MNDKPYTERTGGSYVRDKETGKLTRRTDTKAVAAEVDNKPVPATEKKGK